jgi:membrane dipeptidase
MMNNDSSLAARIDKLHAHGLVDLHYDLLMDLYEKRKRKNVLTTEYLPQFRSGGIGVVAANIFLMDVYLPEMGLRVALDQIGRLYTELDQTDHFAVCRSYDDIIQARQKHQIALLIAMEGVEPLGNDIDLLRVFYELGLRELSLTHARRNWAGSGGLFAAGGSSQDGLTPFGREVVRQCEVLGIIVDLAHINPAGFREVLGMTTRPVIVSHTNPSRFYDIERNISDDQIKIVGERGGVVGVGAVLLSANKEDIHLDNCVDQIEYVANLIGLEAVGLGFDFFEAIYDALPESVKIELKTSLPEPVFIPDLANHAQARNLTAKLIERGFSDDDIEKILYRNFMRIFRELL